MNTNVLVPVDQILALQLSISYLFTFGRSSDEDMIADFEDPEWQVTFEDKPAMSSRFGPDEMQADEAVTAQKCIAFVPNLVQLLQATIGTSCSVCQVDLVYKPKMVGTCLVVSWHCPKNSKQHKGTWASQPRTVGMYAGNILVPSCLITSGNSYAKVALMAKFLKLGFVNKSSHYR